MKVVEATEFSENYAETLITDISNEVQGRKQISRMLRDNK